MQICILRPVHTGPKIIWIQCACNALPLNAHSIHIDRVHTAKLTLRNRTQPRLQSHVTITFSRTRTGTIYNLVIMADPGLVQVVVFLLLWMACLRLRRTHALQREARTALRERQFFERRIVHELQKWRRRR